MQDEPDRRKYLKNTIEISNSSSHSHGGEYYTPMSIQDKLVPRDNDDFFDSQVTSHGPSFNSQYGSLGHLPRKFINWRFNLNRDDFSCTNNDNLPINVDDSDSESSPSEDLCICNVSCPTTLTRETHLSMTTKSNTYDRLSSHSESTWTFDSNNMFHGLKDNNSLKDSGHTFDFLNTLTPACHQRISLLPHLAKAAQPHQIEGLRFLYDNIIEDATTFDRSKGGFGCILAHSMGLGKTFQSVSFTELFFRCTDSTHVLVIVPVNTLYNWLREFDLWLPPRNTLEQIFTKHDTGYFRSFNVLSISEQEKTFKQRFNVLLHWKIQGGVLIMGYEQFRNLVGLYLDLQPKMKKKPRKLNSQSRDVYEILCDPGPDLVICDEGHRIKNEEAAISIAIKSIRTMRRIMLTGYPLQNNLLEYWCMVDFVRPNYLGSKKEFRNLFLRPIENGQCQNSMPEDVRIMLQRIHVLHHMLSGIIQRKGEVILSRILPRKLEYVFFISLSKFQSQLYDVIINDLREERSTNSNINPLLAFAICCKIWNHPEILFDITKRCCSDSDLNRSLFEDEEDRQSRREDPKDFYNLVTDPKMIRNCFKGYKPKLLENGPKFLILFDILEISVSMGEKVLVFSQSIPTLNLLEDFLHKTYVPNQTFNKNASIQKPISYSTQLWKLNYNYFRLDGSSGSLNRHKMISDFNNPKLDQFKLFLISTRAGSLGINLIAATRIVILDVSWNPCHDAQAVCRSYRYGQVNECFVYRLIADGTFESKMYKRQISKISTSDRVLDQLRPERIVTKEDIFTAITSPVEHVNPVENLHLFAENYTDYIIKNICFKRDGVLTRAPILHESFFIDSSDDRLNDKEKKEASKIYQCEKNLCQQRELSSRQSNDTSPLILDTNRVDQEIILQDGFYIPETFIPPNYPKASSPNYTSVRNMSNPIIITSPISLTDSDSDLVSEFTYPNPVQTLEEPFPSSSTREDFPLIQCPHTSKFPTFSLEEPTILIIDSPSIQEALDKDESVNDVHSICLYNPTSNIDSQCSTVKYNVIMDEHNSQSSSVSFIDEIHIIPDN